MSQMAAAHCATVTAKIGVRMDAVLAFEAEHAHCCAVCKEALEDDFLEKAGWPAHDVRKIVSDYIQANACVPAAWEGAGMALANCFRDFSEYVMDEHGVETVVGDVVGELPSNHRGMASFRKGMLHNGREHLDDRSVRILRRRRA